MHYQQIYHYLTLFPSSNIFEMTEQQLRNMCFQGISTTKQWGYGSKRIGIKIPGSITDKIAFSGFGFKESTGEFKIGVRMWLDQGNYVKYVLYDKNYTINQHFMELIHKFQYEYPNLC
jgi:hypothetical protein